MADLLRWPKIMPAWAYRDPQLIGDGKGDGVPRETTTPPPDVQPPAPSRPIRDRHYTQARRLYIRNLVKLLRGL